MTNYRSAVGTAAAVSVVAAGLLTGGAHDRRQEAVPEPAMLRTAAVAPLLPTVSLEPSTGRAASASPATARVTAPPAAVADASSGAVVESFSAAVSAASAITARRAAPSPVAMPRLVPILPSPGGGHDPDRAVPGISAAALAAVGAPAVAVVAPTGAFLGLIGPGGLLIGDGVLPGQNGGLFFGNGADG
ncbi:hypothetical protein [Mycolicibacterium grossiae]|nr:hypothetical protein [Mycolicibacterium grossiae]